MTEATVHTAQGTGARLATLALEITGTCQASCTHCYAGSGPAGTHGTMQLADWLDVIDQAVALGVRMVQFIGGEPTLHPDLDALVTHALGLDDQVAVEVFSNLIHVRPAIWDTLSRPGVCLATSYYSTDPAEHETITRARGSYQRTKANISEAVSRGIPVRASIVDVLEDQLVDHARAELTALGVQQIRIDRQRGIGRGAGGSDPRTAELCGLCGHQRAAVSPTGDVTPCVMSRWLISGNIREQGLAEILSGPAWRANLATVPARTGTACNPDSDGSDCSPAESTACGPKY